jgi:ATP-dependent RNA helicase DeaD
MLKFLKMVAERRDHNGRSSGGGGFGGRSSAPRREGFAPRREVQAVVEATETQVQRRWIWWKKLCSKRRRFWRKKFSSRGEGSSDRAPRRSESLVTHLDQEDQEETNIYC